MTHEEAEAITILRREFSECKDTISVYARKRKKAFDISIKSIEALDKLDTIIVEQLDKSTDQKECMTLRWVLDRIAEVDTNEDNN